MTCDSVLLPKLLPFILIAAIGGIIILIIKNKDQIIVELKKRLKKWWKNRNEKQTS